MACGETGEGRMAEPQALADYLLARLELQQLTIAADALSGRHIVITAGPTREAIDPVRFISNHSSGKQGYALASCLAAAGASVTLISGPTALPAAAGVTRISVTSARDMAQAVSTALPADVAICAAAVSDWQVGTPADTKLKKQDGGFAPQWEASPDILHMLGHSPQRPPLLIGFAAETGDIGPKAREKCQRKNCDLVITNDVSGGRIFGEDETEIAICTPDGCETLAPGSKRHISAIITQRITEALT
jgi:phosphopantothenoylcysteine decarboxylase/phosphopantothenate--cysteine ligase